MKTPFRARAFVVIAAVLALCTIAIANYNILRGGGEIRVESDGKITLAANANKATVVKRGTKAVSLDISNVTDLATRTITFPDSNTTVPIVSQILTISGPTAARTITLPDLNFTAARSDAAQTLTGAQTSDTSFIAPLFRSSVAKVLLQGTGTGATQISSTQTTVPTCSTNCGTSPSVAGSDSDMVVTMGASGSPASGWVVTFNGTWAAAPACVVQSALSGMAAGKAPIVVAATTTTITVTTNGTAPATSDKYAIICRGTQ
jgi:hypothetical protein